MPAVAKLLMATSLSASSVDRIASASAPITNTMKADNTDAENSSTQSGEAIDDEQIIKPPAAAMAIQARIKPLMIVISLPRTARLLLGPCSGRTSSPRAGLGSVSMARTMQLRPVGHI